MQSVQTQIAAAREAANAGRWDEAETLWRDVYAHDPGNEAALFALAVHRFRRGDAQGALPLAEAACAVAPKNVLAWLTLARVRGALGDSAGEGASIQGALVANPYDLGALLAKGGWLERNGAGEQAALYYRNAVSLAPREPNWPDMLRPALTRARDVARSHAVATHAHLSAAVETLVDILDVESAARWREAVAILAGVSEPYHAAGNRLHVPRLPAIPFFNRSQFAWCEEAEAACRHVRRDLDELLSENQSSFEPYIAIRPGAPVDQWRELDGSLRWSAFSLWRHGERLDKNLAACRATDELLSNIDLAHIEGHAPNAMFSALAPRTRIPPHTGETNARLVAHLPLVVPEGCGLRVGFEERRWREGKVLVFDDAIEHEAWNESDDLRVVLIFDVWNPLLTLAERELVKLLLRTACLFHGGASPAD